MINATDIVVRMESALDAENSLTVNGRYNWNRDFKPAINYAQEWMVSLFSAVFAENKFTEENLADLLNIRIWKTNKYSRFVFQPSVVGHKLWTTIGVYPNPEIYPNTPIVQTDLFQSVYSFAHSYIKAYKSAKRITSEEVNLNRKNPFAAGNEVTICDELIECAYKTTTNFAGGYNSATGTDINGNEALLFEPEISLYPDTRYANVNVAMEYLKFPTSVVNLTDNIEFPLSMANIIIEKSLEWIAYKQGTSELKQVTKEDIAKLTVLMS